MFDIGASLLSVNLAEEGTSRFTSLRWRRHGAKHGGRSKKQYRRKNQSEKRALPEIAEDEQDCQAWCDTVAGLPRKQTRVLTWPVVTVFGFIARPRVHVFLKPMVTRTAAREYGFHFEYESRPNWRTYASLLEFADTARRDLHDLSPRDMIDIQSFMGSGLG